LQSRYLQTHPQLQRSTNLLQLPTRKDDRRRKRTHKNAAPDLRRINPRKIAALLKIRYPNGASQKLQPKRLSGDAPEQVRYQVLARAQTDIQEIFFQADQRNKDSGQMRSDDPRVLYDHYYRET
jgi:cation transport regulator ChaB